MRLQGHFPYKLPTIPVKTTPETLLYRTQLLYFLYSMVRTDHTVHTMRHPQYQSFEQYSQSLSLDLGLHLDARQGELLKYIQDFKGNPTLSAEQNEWLARSYPVLAVLAPVMSTNEEKIEFPGDPMILYSALSHAVDQVVYARKQGLSSASPYSDLCPQWGYLPSAENRRSVDDNGIRQYDAPLLNTDQTVFDPRVWNEAVKEYFVNVVLKNVRPKVVLISAVSPAHRYALDIARAVREHLPGCIIVLGGRHVDETIRLDPETQELALQPTSTLSKIADGSIEPVIDFIIAGEGYYALDVLMKAISLAMDIPTRTISVASVLNAL